MAVRDYKGAAPRTTLAGAITNSATSFTVAAGGGTGYPTGSGGNFSVAIDTGLTSEEKILCSARAGDLFTVAAGGRGWDDTAAAAHNNGAAVDHVGGATDLREANAHVNDTTGDPHPQYLTPAEGVAAFVSRSGVAEAFVGTSESTTSGAYTDLATPGPAVTVTTGTRALVIVTGRLTNPTSNTYALMGYEISGATTTAAATAASLVLRGNSSTPNEALVSVMTVALLTPGANTFTAKYSTTAGSSCSFSDRRITVIPL